MGELKLGSQTHTHTIVNLNNVLICKLIRENFRMKNTNNNNGDDDIHQNHHNKKT